MRFGFKPAMTAIARRATARAPSSANPRLRLIVRRTARGAGRVRGPHPHAIRRLASASDFDAFRLSRVYGSRRWPTSRWPPSGACLDGAASARRLARAPRIRPRFRVAADKADAAPNEPCAAVGARCRNTTSALHRGRGPRRGSRAGVPFPGAARSGRASAGSASRTPRSETRRNGRSVPRPRSRLGGCGVRSVRRSDSYRGASDGGVATAR
jgi:hypothetical protein